MPHDDLPALQDAEENAIRTPLAFRLGDYRAIGKRVWLLSGFHNMSLLAGGVAFFCFLAITPLIAATVLLYGLIANVDTVRNQMALITGVLPRSAAVLIEEQLTNVVTTSSAATGLGLVIALAVSLYGAMYAANGLVSALNVINQELETRSFVSRSRRVFGLTLAAIMVGLTGILSGGLFAWLSTVSNPFFGPIADTAFRIAAWVAALALGTLGFALIMRFGPDRRLAKWRWLTPGAILATALWMAASFGLSLYVAYVSDYSATYGSLSAVVVFLMWLYLSAYGLLVGALLNAEMERQTFADSTRGPDRPIGERGAVLADTAVDTELTERYLQKRKWRDEDRLARSTRFGMRRGRRRENPQNID